MAVVRAVDDIAPGVAARVHRGLRAVRDDRTAFLIVTGPQPADSSTMISPLASVAFIAAANVRHGELSEQVELSTPAGETNVR